ncbi:hypothetical protein HHK36_026318 [Tetracentron sinense]|uniref:Flowering time control protein FCA n=1 Tax=Tetracentron sinense TaxID=13715 RepID=A0A835D5C7_TETSI|nr:hypothetical protein HHK36_026318 [Tetracentron sinense]
MDRRRGERYGTNPETHHNRHSRMPYRSSESPMNHHHRNPNNYRGGFSGGGHHHRPFDSPPHQPLAGFGFRPIESDGFDSAPPMPLSGQKRGFPFPGRGGSPDHTDGSSFAKLFVGSVPRTATEEDIRPLFEEHGNVIEVALIKDKRTGLQQGCCFIKFATSDEADRAIRALHNQYTLPGGVSPIQVRYADGERERLGAVEYKLFVGSLNKQATEKEVEEIFSPYGRVEDVYIMRDEQKQSRGVSYNIYGLMLSFLFNLDEYLHKDGTIGRKILPALAWCGFVKFSHRDMALAAINALNGTYLMRGCDQPLTVRFADPKRPRAGEQPRGNPAFGGPGFGPRSQAPGFRPAPNLGDTLGGHIPPNAWHPMSPQNVGLSSEASTHGFGGHLGPRGGLGAMSSTPGGPLGVPDSPANGSLPGHAVVPSSTSQQSFNPSMPSVGQQISPLHKPLQSPQHLPPSLQLHPQQTPASYTQTQNSQVSLQQLGQLQNSHSAGQPHFSQALPSQQLFGMSGQLSVSQVQVQQSSSTATVQQNPLNLKPVSAAANQQQLPAPTMQQQLLQPLHQSPSQLAQMLSQQTQALQASFQSSQQAFSQLQQQLQLMQPSSQSLMQQQSSQASKQQSPWTGIVPQTGASTPTASATVAPSTTSTVSVAPVSAQVAAPLTCNWTEHTSPDGYKYYYNSVTSESRWEKPEELTLFEQHKQQQQQKPSVQQPQSQSHPQVLSSQQVSQTQHVQLQTQLRHQQQLPLSSSYKASGVVGHQNVQELGYAQPQAAANSVDPACFQQGLQAAQQEWMWKNKPSGT